MFSAHQYGGVNCSDASGWSFVLRDTYRCDRPAVMWRVVVSQHSLYDTLADTSRGAQGASCSSVTSTWLLQPASLSRRLPRRCRAAAPMRRTGTSDAWAPTLRDTRHPSHQAHTCSFIDGFYYLTALGLFALGGATQVRWSTRRPATHMQPLHPTLDLQVNRQDLAGFSFIGMGSNYALAWAPGWINASVSGPLSPHPDWYTTVSVGPHPHSCDHKRSSSVCVSLVRRCSGSSSWAGGCFPSPRAATAPSHPIRPSMRGAALRSTVSRQARSVWHG